MSGFTMPPMPYAFGDLVAKAAGFTDELLNLHYSKHACGYATKLNKLAETQEKLQKMTLEQIVMNESGAAVNLAGQMINHAIYFNSMSPNGGGEPSGRIGEEITKSFGSFAAFKAEMTQAAVGHFGSGWAWLVKDPKSGKLLITQTHDAGTPITAGQVPLLTIDVWEHAWTYSSVWKNDKAAYVDSFWKVANWKYAEQNLLASSKQ